MTANAILTELRSLGQEGYRNILLRHGAAEPCYGVKIEELKKIQKRIKVDYRLALELFDSGVYDAQYLAGLIADDTKMTREDLCRWAEAACAPLAGSTVAWVAAGSPHGWALALDWIESERELVAVAGWGTLSCLVSIKDDSQLDVPALKKITQRVQKLIHRAPNLVRYHMNGFVISVGCYVKALTATALEVGEAIGHVSVEMGETACTVPFAPDYIKKVQQRGTVGKKRKTVK